MFETNSLVGVNSDHIKPYSSNDANYNKSSKENIIEIVEFLCQKYKFKTIQDTGELYYYNESNGIFEKNGDIIIKKEVEEINPNILTKEVIEIINKIKRRTPIRKNDFNPHIEWLVCKNCTLNLITLQTVPHSHEFMSTIRIPLSYEDNDILSFYESIDDPLVLLCPRILNFLSEIMSQEDCETVLDFFSYCLWRGIPFHKILICVGEGRNGKGVLMQILSKVLGGENISNLSIHNLVDNRFAKAELQNKYVNIDSDVSSSTLKNTGIIKKISGNDVISAERKFEQFFQFTNTAKLILLANKLPKIDDDTDANFLRLIIINFQNQFIEDNADPYLADKLTIEEEMIGLFRILIRRLTRVLKYGISYSKSIEEIYDLYISDLDSDSLWKFIATKVERSPDSTVSKTVMYDAYRKYCQEEKINFPESRYTLSSQMKKYGYIYKEIRKNNEKDYYWIGINIKVSEPS